MEVKVKREVMVVDDDVSLRTSIRLVLENEGYKVTEAVDAKDCWNGIKYRKPDLILLDIMMPGMTTTQLIERINKDNNLKSIKIIFITAVPGARKLIKKTENVLGTIEKPFENKELVAIVKKALA